MGKKKTKPVNVNLGCGTHIIDGWINIDNYIGTDNPNFLQGDVRSIPLADASVDYLLCDNVLEHLPMSDVIPTLYEIRRVLKKGGRAVLIVPDFRNAIDSWAKIDWDNAFNPHFYHYLSEVIYGNQMHEGEYHKTPFCPGYFSFVLKVAGLTNVRLISHPQFGDAPGYPGCRSIGQKLRSAELVADVTK